MIRYAQSLIAPSQRIPMKCLEYKTFHLKNADWLHVQIPFDVLDTLSECLNHRVSEHVEIAESVLGRHPFLILPSRVISDHGLNAQDGHMGREVAQELS